MKEMILRVVKCGECFTVKSEKSEGGVLNKRTLVLQELGGKYGRLGNRHAEIPGPGVQWASVYGRSCNGTD